jgi:hypothetical protein
MLQDGPRAEFIINVPALLMMGFAVAVLFIILGYRERVDITKREKSIRIGLGLLGLMVIVTPLSWYGSLAIIGGVVQMRIGEILLLTTLAALGGVIVGVSIYFGRKS